MLSVALTLLAHVVDVSFVDGMLSAPDVAVRVEIRNRSEAACTTNWSMRWPSIGGDGTTRTKVTTVPPFGTVDVFARLSATSAVGLNASTTIVELTDVRCEPDTAATAPVEQDGLTPPIEALHPVIARSYGPAVELGGPVVELLFRDIGESTMSIRGGLGYEMALGPRWLVSSASVETNFSDHVDVALGTLAVMPPLPLGPHGPPLFGVGAGLAVPVELAPIVQPGLRFETLFHIGGVFGLVSHIDLYAREDRFRAFFGVRGSL
ncbi:MAG TPA: hypothetical protein VGM90_00375 [Kofleriaceae bacterium]|jgi:hypothetical protein